MADMVDVISQSVFAEVAARLAIAAIVGFIGSLFMRQIHFAQCMPYVANSEL